jgi:hypothetical protein
MFGTATRAMTRATAASNSVRRLKKVAAPGKAPPPYFDFSIGIGRCVVRERLMRQDQAALDFLAGALGARNPPAIESC